MACLPISRAWVGTVVVVCLFGRAANTADCLAAECITNATPSTPEVKVVVKIDASPAAVTINPRADLSPVQPPQPTNVVEIDPAHVNRPKVERVTTLAVIKPKLQETPLVIRPYVEMN